MTDDLKTLIATALNEARADAIEGADQTAQRILLALERADVLNPARTVGHGLAGLHAALQTAYAGLLAASRALPPGLSPSAAISLGVALASLTGARGQVGRDVDDQRAREKVT